MSDNGPFNYLAGYTPTISADLVKALQPPLSKLNPAKWAYEKLMDYIYDFEQQLDSEHEVGARFVSFNLATVFHIQAIGYKGPNMITFYGINENDEKVQLIQDVTQLNVLLVAAKKLGDSPKRIGFIVNNENSNKEDSK